MEEKIKGCMESGKPQLCVWDDDEYRFEDCSVAVGHKSADQCKTNCKLWSPSQAAQYFEAFPDEDKDTVRIEKSELAELKAANKTMRGALEEAALFLSWLPSDLGRGSLNGKKAQAEYAIGQAIKEAE